jgi:hypothetical protein
MERVLTVASSLFTAVFAMLLVLSVLAFGNPVWADEQLPQNIKWQTCGEPSGSICPVPNGCPPAAPECCYCVVYLAGAPSGAACLCLSECAGDPEDGPPCPTDD